MKSSRQPISAPPAITLKKRCAVYTRKSTDEGLDQASCNNGGVQMVRDSDGEIKPARRKAL